MDFTGRIKDVYHLPEDGIQLLWENVEVVSFRKKEVEKELEDIRAAKERLD